LASKDVILVVSGEEGTRNLVSKPFQRAGHVTTEVASGEEALAASDRPEIALAIVDLGLQDMSGFELCHELRERSRPDLRIILLSSDKTAPSDSVAGFLIGADDYVAAPFHPDELLVRARRLLDGSARKGTVHGLHLTARETEVLRLMAQGLGQDAMAKRLFISPKTVATHAQNILTKLGVHSRAEAVALAYRAGLIEERDKGKRPG
jgi:DNA-binding NarL/FixJ family response regulator